MMPINSNKRKGRLNPNSKLGKCKFYPEKNMLCDGIYGNSKLMYAAASLVGCVVQIQVQNGAVFEGVLRTFSHQLDIVLEMAHKVNSKSTPVNGVGPSVSNLIASYPFEGGIFDKLIFKLSDIISMVASTVDMDYAVKDNFTDTAISKFNGQVRERELEPWEDAGSDSEGTVGFSIEDDEGTNGWDANDMFRTNAEKYGVKSSYDNSLQDYTVPLMKKDTEEYKLQEAKALKIAQEIETSNSYQSSIQLENENEEEKFSAVVRTNDPTASKYILSQKRRHTAGFKRQHAPPNSSKLHLTSGPSTLPNQTLQYSSTFPVLDESPHPLSGFPNVINATLPKTGAAVKDVSLGNENAEPSLECVNSESSSKTPVMYSTQTLPPRIERRRESEKKFSKHKGRTDEIEEFKKFSSNFKLTDEKDLHECGEVSKVDALTSKIERTQIDKEEDNVVKFSTLNPNAKEFVFNPNAKSFTPRSLSVVTPPVPPSPSMSPMMSVPQMIPQPIFTAMGPQYVMQASPVSVAITSPFAAANQPAPRFRKATSQSIPSQLAVQYSSAPGVLHAQPQPGVGYPQMNFVVGPRVVSPQPVIPTSHSVSYCDTSHLPTHLIMSAHPGASHSAATAPHTLHQGQQLSNHHPPQCHTPVIHPSPPPVHQVPPPSHSQPSTPTAVMYSGGQHHPMHHRAYAGGPQQLVLMQQQQQPTHHALQMHSLHSQTHTGAHMGGPTHILPQMAITMTSAPTPPFIQHL